MKIINYTDEELIALWNEKEMEENSNFSIYENTEEFLKTHFTSVVDVAKAITYGSYNMRHKYVRYNGYENLETTNNPYDFMDLDELEEYLNKTF